MLTLLSDGNCDLENAHDLLTVYARKLFLLNLSNESLSANHKSTLKPSVLFIMKIKFLIQGRKSGGKLLVTCCVSCDHRFTDQN